MNDLRIGHSWDVHKLVEGRDLYLGGIKLDYSLGLLGHSDADVLLHAITESIIGALGLGDLGTLYPDTIEATKGMDSKVMLREVVNIMKEKGYRVNNIDTIIFAEVPKLSPFKEDIKKSVANLLEVEESRVNIKATTHEKMGYIGNKEAIAAESVVLLVK